MDPKHLNIPNICFSLTEPDDGREELFTQQRLERGFDDSETWSLSTTIADFILPRLKRFKELATNHPIDISMETWCSILDKMIFAFECESNRYNSEFKHTEQTVKDFKEGLELFKQYYTNLWW